VRVIPSKRTLQSLRFRIFVSLIGITIISFVAIAIVTIFQYRKQSQTYHSERLLHKEQQLIMQIRYVFSQTTFPVEDKYIPLIFREEIYRIADIENVNFNLYSINGTFLISSQAALRNNELHQCISDTILDHLSNSVDKRLVFQTVTNEDSFQYSYSYINDLQYKPLLILHIPHFENDTFNEGFLLNSLYNLGWVYVVILLITIGIAFLISRYITHSFKVIQKKLRTTHFLGKNEKINLKNTTTEIGELIFSYNEMVDEIEKSKKALAKIERERIWKDMAKQIAHEIKNPLTPMRLSVQNFDRKFDPQDPQSQEKVHNFTQMLLQHIDTLSDISDAFSSLVSMPVQKKEIEDMNTIIKRTIAVFDTPYIHFTSELNHIYISVDKNQINRMLTNLLKNAIYATENVIEPKIEIISSVEDNEVCIIVKDNGNGVPLELQERIFEPNFTTKNSGSGLGLAMVKHIVKAHNGEITLDSQEGEGATFIVKLKKDHI